MPDRTKATAAPTASTAGVLRPDEFARHVALVREAVGLEAAPWVENRWSLRWTLPDGRWYRSEVIPHPTCSLTVELGSHPRSGMPPGETVVVTGVCTRRFDVDVRGWGRVVGLRFRPGGLAALTGPGGMALGFGTLDDHEAPGWPNEHGSKQFHLDLAVDDLDGAAAECVGLGATLPDEQPGETWRVLLDPSGHPFCLTQAANWG